MKILRSLFYFTFYRILPVITLFCFAPSSGYAIKRSGGGDASNLSVGDLAAKKVGPASIPTSFFIIVGGVIFCALAGWFALRHFQQMKDEEIKNKVAYDQALLGLESELESLRVTPQDRDALHILVDTEDPEKLLPVIKSNELFEKLFTQFKKGNPDPKEVQMINDLRRSLNFVFSNSKLPFLCSQMLPADMNLECEISFKGKNIFFLSPILETTENRILLKPPMVKGRPANLRQFPSVTCRLRRAKDADYQFTLKIVEQSIEENAVILSHTTDIRKMSIRDSERIPMDVSVDFRVVHQEQYELGEDFEIKVNGDAPVAEGHIVDMSAGGVKIHFTEMPKGGIDSEHKVLFHLKYASLRRDLVGEVLNVLKLKQYYAAHLRFQDNDMLTRMRLSQYLHRVKKSQSADGF